MKVRNGFISNSSSSSFIVAVDGDTEVEIKFKTDLIHYGKLLKTSEEVTAHFNYEYDDDWEEDSLLVSRHNACIEAVVEGRTVIIGSFHSDGGEPRENFLFEHGIREETEGIEIIYTEGRD